LNDLSPKEKEEAIKELITQISPKIDRKALDKLDEK
jgi:hypothetical protein